MTYAFEWFRTLKEARERCAELERQHDGKFVGIYQAHRGYRVLITNPFEPGMGEPRATS